jgi:peptide/nickel transport system substrate-binding protein
MLKKTMLMTALTAALVLSACGAAPTPGAPAAAPATEAATAVPAAPTPRILRLRVPTDLTNADPAFHPASPDTLSIEAIADGLVTFKPGTWELQNVLAETLETSPDGLRITFKLREGVQFHGGYGELTADDVKFSYERFLDPALNAPYKGDWETLDKVEVTGKYTGVIVLKTPFSPLFASTLPVTAGVIISKKAYEALGDKFGTQPIGSGPYAFSEWVPKQRIVLKRNDAYWGDKPAFDEIHLIPIVDDSAAEVALEAGDIDFTTVSQAAEARLAENSAFQVKRQSTINYSGIFINIEDPALKDLRVREALRLAVDVPAIATAVYEGKVERACAIVAPGQIGHWADATCYAVDLDKAKALLNEAGVSALSLKLTAEQGDRQKAVSEIIQANLKAIGVDVTIDQVDGSAYWGDDKVLRARQLTLFDWGTTNPDPHWQTVWFSCAQFGAYNWMYWCDPAFDKLNAAATAEQDPAKRSALYVEAQQRWQANANVIWTIRPSNVYVSRVGITPAQSPNGLPILRAFGAQARQ